MIERDIRFTALDAVRKKINETTLPKKASLFGQAASHAGLSDPDNRNNRYYDTLPWPIEEDVLAACDIKVNFPGQRLKNGKGYVGTTFRYETTRPGFDIRKTELEVIYGLGSMGLIVPFSPTLTYQCVQLESQEPPIPELQYVPHMDEVARILGKFGIVSE